ncbi:MAG: S1-like domain-containing RNA-binding protein [Candidatus Delongbacteria bacterium]|jgi:predicted RNA-binding protein (virulence factor B family)|nr:S1-like domain-containing RNA-binding protein [Candidatus Delongbacteria bacterium]
MAEIGKINKLEAIRSSEVGMYLDGGLLGEILLPNSYLSDDIKVGSEVEVFIYHDHKQRLTATTQKPKGVVDEYVFLKAVSVSSIGAFMDMGLQKDLYVPFTEQNEDFKEGNSYLIYILIDKMNDKIIGTSKVNKYLESEPKGFKIGDEVEILVCNQTDIGYNVIINDYCWGLVHSSDIKESLRTNDRMKAYVKNIKDEFKIDISFQGSSVKKVYELTDVILDKIKENGGTLAITDKSSPEDIFAMFKVSKKVYKKSIGALYKHRLIELDGDVIKIKNK